MAKGIAINIGLDRVNPAHYGGWDGQLAACEFDAKDMCALAQSRRFQTRLILGREATAAGVTDAIRGAARALAPGDILLLSYSGHGGQVPDANSEEEDRQDETWVLYDRQLVDDELYSLWGGFAPGVRILVFSDSCHSGTVARARQHQLLVSNPELTAGLAEEATPRTRALPIPVQNVTYERNRELYDGIQASHPAGERVSVGASVILFSGCQDNQLSSDGARNGLFTATMLKAWGKGRFKGGYRRFHKRIQDRMPLYQSPNFFTVGPQNAAFEAQTPFTI